MDQRTFGQKTVSALVTTAGIATGALLIWGGAKIYNAIKG